MHETKENLPILLQTPDATIRTARWSGMAVAYAQYAKGTDFTPAFKGLKDDMCPCPHWGYVLKGALLLRYSDGTEEVIKAGELWYAQPGHTARCEEDTEIIDFSPEQPFEQVVSHVRKQMES